MLLLTLLQLLHPNRNRTSESVKGLHQTFGNPFGGAARWVRNMQILRAVGLILTSCVAVSADTKGVIGGRVTDPQNAAISQATVGLTNTIDGRRLETTTNDEGLFEFRFVDVGEYTITYRFLDHLQLASLSGGGDDQPEHLFTREPRSRADAWT